MRDEKAILISDSKEGSTRLLFIVSVVIKDNENIESSSARMRKTLFIALTKMKINY